MPGDKPEATPAEAVSPNESSQGQAWEARPSLCSHSPYPEMEDVPSIRALGGRGPEPGEERTKASEEQGCGWGRPIRRVGGGTRPRSTHIRAGPERRAGQTDGGWRGDSFPSVRDGRQSSPQPRASLYLFCLLPAPGRPLLKRAQPERAAEAFG